MHIFKLTGISVLLAGIVAAAPSATAADLVKYKIVDNAIPKSLTGKKGDPKKGRRWAINRKLGNCLACHEMPIPEQPYHGKIAPDLNGVGSRLTEGQIRLRIVDAKKLNPDTIMPAFYRATGFHRVMKKFAHKTILTAQQVEDIVAYLTTLKDKK